MILPTAHWLLNFVSEKWWKHHFDIAFPQKSLTFFCIPLIQRTLYFKKIFLSTLPISVLNVRSELSCELSSSELNWAWIAKLEEKGNYLPKGMTKACRKSLFKASSIQNPFTNLTLNLKVCVCVLIDFFPSWIPARPFTSPLHPKNANIILCFFLFKTRLKMYSV